MFTHLLLDGSDGTLERNSKPRFNRNASKRLVNDEIIMGLDEYYDDQIDIFTVAVQCDTELAYELHADTDEYRYSVAS